MSDDEVWRRDEIESPCIKVCIVHPTERICIGCYRTMDEIREWSRLDPPERRHIMATLHQRAERVKPTRRGGRKARKT